MERNKSIITDSQIIKKNKNKQNPNFPSQYLNVRTAYIKKYSTQNMKQKVESIDIHIAFWGS